MKTIFCQTNFYPVLIQSPKFCLFYSWPRQIFQLPPIHSQFSLPSNCWDSQTEKIGSMHFNVRFMMDWCHILGEFPLGWCFWIRWCKENSIRMIESISREKAHNLDLKAKDVLIDLFLIDQGSLVWENLQYQFEKKPSLLYYRIYQSMQ